MGYYLWIVFFDPGNSRYLLKSRHGHRIVPQSIFIRGKSVVKISHLLSHTTWSIKKKKTLRKVKTGEE